MALAGPALARPPRTPTDARRFVAQNRLLSAWSWSSARVVVGLHGRTFGPFLVWDADAQGRACLGRQKACSAELGTAVRSPPDKIRSDARPRCETVCNALWQLRVAVAVLQAAGRGRGDHRAPLRDTDRQGRPIGRRLHNAMGAPRLGSLTGQPLAHNFRGPFAGGVAHVPVRSESRKSRPWLPRSPNQFRAEPKKVS